MRIKRSTLRRACVATRRITAAPNPPYGISANPNPAAAETTTYGYDPNGNLTSRQTPSLTDLFGYDPLDRLTVDQYATLSPGSIGYDPNGNRTSRAFEGFSETYTYSANTNRLTNKGAQAIIQDAAGHTTNDGTYCYTYNNAGRLTQVDSGGTVLATYTYNAQGQRTRKVTPQGTTVYHYDTQGNLIEETTDTGQTTKDYVYADSIPIAQIDKSTTEDVTYLHTDHLGTPRLGTDQNQTVVWYWRSLAFGSIDPLDDPDGDGTATTINLRFAGQYADAESGLFYNWNRYYDPRTGRYVTSDPVGLVAGTNTYAYVENNPLQWIDPLGLFCIPFFDETTGWSAYWRGNPSIQLARPLFSSGTGALGTCFFAKITPTRQERKVRSRELCWECSSGCGGGGCGFQWKYGPWRRETRPGDERESRLTSAYAFSSDVRSIKKPDTWSCNDPFTGRRYSGGFRPGP